MTKCFIETICHHATTAPSHGASQPVMLFLAVLAAVPLYLLIRPAASGNRKKERK